MDLFNQKISNQNGIEPVSVSAFWYFWISYYWNKAYIYKLCKSDSTVYCSYYYLLLQFMAANARIYKWNILYLFCLWAVAAFSMQPEPEPLRECYVEMKLINICTNVTELICKLQEINQLHHSVIRQHYLSIYPSIHLSVYLSIYFLVYETMFLRSCW